MITDIFGKLALNLSHLTRGLVKYAPGRGYFRPVSSQNGDKNVTSPAPPQSLNWSIVLFGHGFDKLVYVLLCGGNTKFKLPKAGNGNVFF